MSKSDVILDYGSGNLRSALRALERSAWACEALGADFHRVYLAIKQGEYRQFMAEVGEQDWRWYLGHA